MSDDKKSGWKDSPMRPTVVGIMLLVLLFLAWRTISVYPCYERCVHKNGEDCLRQCGFWSAY